MAPVRSLILATKHHRASAEDDVDTKLLLDIDLSILGARPSVFKHYEHNIRREYAHVPEEVYRKKRSEILEQFLSSTPLFRTDYCQQRFEKQARLNLADSLRRLRE